jgi:pimeloyl-ACP methyl ester carboxylesterase
MNRVTSKDGTSIAYERNGRGPAVVLVCGGLDDGSENAQLAAELSKQFTVYNYARRGRGDSGDTLPYAVEREIEDIEVLIARAGGSARPFGVSSGGALVLEAAATGLAIDKIAVYEVPYCIAGDTPPTARLAKITRPTLVATGGVLDPHMGALPPDFFDQAADVIAASIPQAERQTLEGQSHVADPKAIAPVLERFFRD